MQQRALLKRPRPCHSLAVEGKPRAAWRAPHELEKALAVPKGDLQPRSSSRNSSGSPTPELPGPSVALGHSQAGVGVTLEPRGDRDRLDTAPPSGCSLNTCATAGQPSAPLLPPTDTLPQASPAPGGVSGPGALPPPNGPAPPDRAPEHAPPAGAPWAAGVLVSQRGAAPHRGPAGSHAPHDWAASALTFLLVVLTLAILYTRLHPTFRKSQSLYWAPGDAGQEPLSGDSSPEAAPVGPQQTQEGAAAPAATAAAPGGIE
ncbi:unnamed protein product [Natator depressus]